MLSTNALSVFILHHHQNGICNKNLSLIQDIMRASKPAANKYKKVCDDFHNLAILTKSATPFEFKLMFAHTSVGNKYHQESVVAFALMGNLDSPSVVFINMDINFSADGDKIRLPITEFLLCTAADLARSKSSGTGRRATPSSSHNFSRVRIPFDDCSLREKLREEDGFARCPVPLLFERARSAAVQRRNSVMGRRILSPSAEKLMSVLMETTEGESRFPIRANATTDSSRYLWSS